MIIIEISVPLISKNYEFSINDNVQTKICIEEILEIICKKEGIVNFDNKNTLLIKESNQKPLIDEFTLSENQIKNGDKLILI